MGLHDASKPAGAIVEVFEEGDALRNDGVRLTAARKNLWYVLATVAGEQGDGWLDYRIAQRNRRYWNGFFGQHLSEQEKVLLAQKMGHVASEFAPFSVGEWRAFRKRFSTAFPGEFTEGEGQDDLDYFLQHDHLFGNTYFPLMFSLEGYYFPRDVDFEFSFLPRFSYFRGSLFSQRANFDHAHFDDYVSFDETAFDGEAQFRSTSFVGGASFLNTRFSPKASFENARFIGDTELKGANFERDAVFKAARFECNVNFSDGVFKGATDFSRTRFSGFVPTFYQREMHQDTTFTEDPAYWPTPTPDNAQEGKQAYTRLRQIAAGNQNPDLEHFFLRQEMRCKEVLANGADRWAFCLYRIFADYGISFARPAFALLCVWGLGVGVFGSYLDYCDLSTTYIADGAMMSLGNTLPFINIGEKMHQAFFTAAPWWIDALSAAQSVAGIVLLFFLGLGLRNRFRLK